MADPKKPTYMESVVERVKELWPSHGNNTEKRRTEVTADPGSTVSQVKGMHKSTKEAIDKQTE